MKGPDLDKERCERKRTLAEFLDSYNKDLPPGFPRASAASLEEFKKSHPELFKRRTHWSLDQHRKKVMDWLPTHIRASVREG